MLPADQRHSKKVYHMSKSDGTPKESQQPPKPFEAYDALELLSVEVPEPDHSKSKRMQDEYEHGFFAGWIAAMRKFGIEPKSYQGGKITW